MMNEQYKSEALAAVHETALGLSEAGVMDKMTMKMFDEMCLIPVMEMGTDFSAHIDSLRSRFEFPVSPLMPSPVAINTNPGLFYDLATTYYNYPVESIAAIDREAETSENQVEILGRLLQPQSTGLLLVRKGCQLQPTRLLGVDIS